MNHFIFLTAAAAILAAPVAVHAQTELRGVWVATAANLDYPSHQTTDSSVLRAEADKILDECNSLGMNAVFFQVRPSGDSLYPGKLYPWSHYLTGQQGLPPSDSFDVLKYWTDAAHNLGMELHAWINPYRVSTAASLTLAENNPARIHPDWVIKYQNGLYLDPGIPDAKSYVIEGIKEIVDNYDVDGIHFDDYFYPGKDFDDSKSYADYGNNINKDDWRRSNTEALIKEASDAVHSSNKDMVFGVSPCGIWANKSMAENGSDTKGISAYYDMYADTLKWARENYIDYIAPQIYWYEGFEAADYTILSTWWQNQLSDCDTKLYIGLGDYRMDKFGSDNTSPWYNGNEILRQIQYNAAAEGIDGEIHFRYSSIINHKSLYDKIKAEYAQYTNKDEINSPPEEAAAGCLYIYYDKFGNPIYTKNVKAVFNIGTCRQNAPDHADYADGVFIAKNGKWKRERVNL